VTNAKTNRKLKMVYRKRIWRCLSLTKNYEKGWIWKHQWTSCGFSQWKL